MCGEAFSKLSWYTPPAAFSFLFFCFLVWDCDLLLPSKLQQRKGIDSRLPMHRLPPESQCDWCKREEILKVAHVSCFTDSTNCSWVVRKSALLFAGASNKTARQLSGNQLHCLLEHQTKLLFNCAKISFIVCWSIKPKFKLLLNYVKINSIVCWSIKSKFKLLLNVWKSASFSLEHETKESCG